MPTTDDATLTDWIEHALNECGDIISLLDNDGHSQGKSLAIGLRATLLTMKGHFGDEADTAFSSGEAGSYAAQWQNEHPKEEGWYWYWHADIVEPIPMRVINVRTDTEYRWEHKPPRYPCDHSEEWWLPMPYDLEGPEPPSAA